MKLSSRYATALVTGASRGLGAAFAAMLCAEGVKVWGTSRRPEARAGVTMLPMDLAEAGSVEAAWRQAEAESGGIDLLVNNAGAAAFGPFDGQTPEQWEAQISVLLFGPARLARLALPAMRVRGRGCIVAVSSLAGEFPIPCLSAYNAGKAALSALWTSLALEARGSPVRILDFRPGDYRTGFNRTMTVLPPPNRPDAAPARVWARLQALADAAPDPARAAGDLRRALARGRRGTVRSGSFFQATLAPLWARWAPAGATRRLHERYFGLD
jgi:NAD(P)-dependent dehydrogenase (short-subunit alcohol dehydrogenase family)